MTERGSALLAALLMVSLLFVAGLGFFEPTQGAI